MHQLPVANNPDIRSPETASDELSTVTLETIPPVMRAIRTLMRAEREKDLTVPQFRTLGFIGRHHNASLKDVADHFGIPMSGASRLIDKLVERKLITRTTNPSDRRKIILDLLPAGEELRARSRQRAQQGLDAAFQRLTQSERDAIARALPLLRDLFSNEPNEASGETSVTTGEPPPS
jgi:DNA-binding MarR family transcriptional regulator